MKRKAQPNPSGNFNDLGFGTGMTSKNFRFINKDGSFNVLRTNNGRQQLNIYQRLVLMSWPKFLAITLGFYFLANCCFACLYILIGVENLNGGTNGSHAGSPFLDAFFFSVQTLTTVGYGSLSPRGFNANLIAALGAFTGLMSFALATGLLFARFSRASASILYSDKAIISPYRKGGFSFQFRMVNQRKNVLTDLQALLVVTWVDQNERMFRTLPLERDYLAFFPLNWTIVHPIDENSPLKDWTADKMEEMDVEFLVILQGYDDTFTNMVSSRYSYKWGEVAWNANFLPMFRTDENAQTILEIEKLSNIEIQKTP